MTFDEGIFFRLNILWKTYKGLICKMSMIWVSRKSVANLDNGKTVSNASPKCKEETENLRNDRLVPILNAL